MFSRSDIKLEGNLEIIFNIKSHSHFFKVIFLKKDLSLLLITSKDFNHLQPKATH